MSNSTKIPPRIGTAPTAKDPKGQLGVAAFGDLRSGTALRQPPPPGLRGLPSRPPAAVGGKSPQPQLSAVRSSGASPSLSPEVAEATNTAPPPAATAATATTPAADEFPEDCMYDIAQFMQLKDCEKPLPELIMEYASSLWKDMPEHLASLQNSSLRDNLFKEDNATMPSKVLADRKLHNEVLGILGKVTEQNLERMKKELTDLPIRQSTEEEISEVINTFFRKCVRPEDSCYTPLYVQLIHHLINTIGEGEEAGRMIRRNVLFQCRDTFTNAKDDAKDLEDRIADLPGEEANLERMQFSGRQKANIYFLGLLFCARIANETVVVTVLENLMYGDGKRRRLVPDYCIVHFMELLQTCGPQMSQKAYQTSIPHFVKSLDELRRNYPQKRIQYLIENFLETMGNDWVPLHGRGAPPPGTQSRGGPGDGQGGQQPQFNIVIPDAKQRVPDREEFWKVMDDYFTTGEVDEIKALIEQIPVDVLTVFMSNWIGRYITTYKYKTERSRLGEMFEQLANAQAVPLPVAQTALLQHVRRAIDEDLFTDQPKYFTHWAAVVQNGRTAFPLSLHTALLDMLVSSHVSRGVLVAMVTDVSKAMDESAKADQKDGSPQDRFRVLQALLRYTPPLLVRSHDADGDLDDELPDDGEDDEADIIDVIADKGVDTEVVLFKKFCESFDEGNNAAQQDAFEALKKSPAMAFAVASAFFTFARFDVETHASAYKELLKKLCAVRGPVSLLEEVYVQWTRLECPESYYISFAQKVIAAAQPSKFDLHEKLRERLRAGYRCEKLIFKMEKVMSKKENAN